MIHTWQNIKQIKDQSQSIQFYALLPCICLSYIPQVVVVIQILTIYISLNTIVLTRARCQFFPGTNHEDKGLFYNTGGNRWVLCRMK
jgi:hypothetical protein